MIYRITKKLQENEHGFTLVELLLVVAIMGLSFGVTSDILLTIMRSFNKTTVMNEIEQQASFVSQKIERDLRNATNVTSVSNTMIRFEDSTGTVYVYDLDDQVGAADVVDGSSVQYVLYRYPSTSSRSLTYALTLNPTRVANVVGGVNVTCSGPCFEIIDGRPQVVHIKMNFAQAQAAPNTYYSGQVTLDDTVVVRNTY
jgi:prepilin-type N-terminal cleavage/methylation domain-containing protein